MSSTILFLALILGFQGRRLPPLKHRFEDFPSKPQEIAVKAPLSIPQEAKPEEAEIRRRYQRGKIGFGGKYVFIPLGCGAGCEGGGIVDATTGQAFPLPGGVSDPPGLPNQTWERIAFRINSRLMVLTGNINEVESNSGKLVRWYYVFSGQGFELIDKEVISIQAQ
ncbi:MAG: hypothetical protein U0P81_14325 [Holophagaceae bacterium]